MDSVELYTYLKKNVFNNDTSNEVPQPEQFDIAIERNIMDKDTSTKEDEKRDAAISNAAKLKIEAGAKGNEDKYVDELEMSSIIIIIVLLNLMSYMNSYLVLFSIYIPGQCQTILSSTIKVRISCNSYRK